MPDIRLATSFMDNIKVVKLRRKYGADAVLGLIRLWCYAAENKPDGILGKIDDDDFAIMCGEHAEGMRGALLELGFIEETKKGYEIHDWSENQPWVVSAPIRKANATKAAKVRWGGAQKGQGDQGDEDDAKGNAESMRGALLIIDLCNAPYLTLPNHTLPNLTIPEHLANSKDFATTWQDWEAARRGAKKKLTLVAVKLQMKALGTMPVSKAIAALETSIMNGWTGIFPTKEVVQKGAGAQDKNDPFWGA